MTSNNDNYPFETNHRQIPETRLAQTSGGYRSRWIRYTLATLLILSTGLISACATLDRADCEAGQWQEIGYRDGARGRSHDVFLGLHDKACAKHGVSVDQTVYKQGYQVGVADFCQPPTGYRLGRNEENYNYICPAELERNFLVAYADGLSDTLRELESYEHFLEDRLWHAKWKHRQYERSYDIEAPDGQSSGGNERHYIVTEQRVLDALKDRIGDYRDRRIRIRNALARAVRVLEATSPKNAPATIEQEVPDDGSAPTESASGAGWPSHTGWSSPETEVPETDVES